MKCETCTHKDVCKYQEAYEKYYKDCNLVSEHADKFKVTVDCTLYTASVPYLYRHPDSSGVLITGVPCKFDYRTHKTI